LRHAKMGQGVNVMSIHKYANPNKFLRLSAPAVPWAAGLTGILLAAGLYLGFLASPPDYRQGETVRIMYIHVPAAWMAMYCYVAMAISCAVGLIWRHPLADFSAKAIAPIGAMFTLVALVTGSLWGRPMWGAFWVWDARLTSVLVLFFLYLGYMALVNAFDDPTRGFRAAGILGMVGIVMVPIIKFSVNWWNTLHQPASVLRVGGPAVHSSMLWPLLTMDLAYKAYFVWIFLVRIRAEIVANKVHVARLRQVHG